MIFEIDIQVLDDERQGPAIDDLLRLVEKGRHSWVAPDLDELRGTSWYQREGAARRRRLEILVHAGERSRRPQLSVVRETRPGWPWALCAADAVTVLSAPVRVLVENAQSDGRLVELALLRVGEKALRRSLGEDAWRTLKAGWRQDIGCRGWVELEHGGGGTLAARLSALSAETLPSPVVALLDGDRAHPQAEHGSTARDALKAAADGRRQSSTQVLAGWEPAVHVLDQRSVESYIPDSALKGKFGKRAEDVTRLNPEQRACWDHKRGLRAELDLGHRETPDADPQRWSWRDDRVKRLYEGVVISGVLTHGLGRDAWRSLLDDDHTTARHLRERAGDELDRLAGLLAKAL